MPETFKAAICNLGCRVNKYEALAIESRLSERGFQIVPFDEKADLYIINTCAVTAEAKRKSMQMIRQAKRRNPAAMVVAAGCVVALEGGQKDSDLSIGNKGKSELADRLSGLFKMPDSYSTDTGDAGLKSGECCTKAKAAAGPEGRPDGKRFSEFEEYGMAVHKTVKAFIKIEDGCNQFCSYCAIPLARGRVSSRNENNILHEIRACAAAGIKEVVLTGIHTCSYGLDRGEDSTALIRLCQKISGIEGIKRIRFGSVEPLSITDDFIQGFSEIPQMCRHMHISLQSGCEKTLRGMRRNYRPDQYFDICGKLRKKMPDFMISTDIMTGFPGESEEDHKESLRFCASVFFSHIHVFPFSPRPFTAAEKLPERVDRDISERRAAEFRRLSEIMHETALKRFIGREITVLAEEVKNIGESTYLSGYTDNYLPALVLNSDESFIPGDLINIRAKSSMHGCILGGKL